MLRRPSLSAYPDDPYYDPDRPSWMPYWWDDTLETNAKAAYFSSKYLGGSVTPQEVLDPNSVYTPPPMPVPNPAVGAGTSTTPAPYDCSPGPLSNPNCPGYDAALAASTAQQKSEQDAANIALMNQVAANIKASTQAQCPGKTLVQNSDGTWSCPSALTPPTWLLWAVGGVAAVVVLTAGSRR